MSAGPAGVAGGVRRGRRRVLMAAVLGLSPFGSMTLFAQASTTTPAIVSDDWRGYGSAAEVRAAYSNRDRRFWNFGGVDSSSIDLVPDPVFGRVVKLTFPRMVPFYDLTRARSGMPGRVVRMRIRLPQAMDAVWVRGRYKFEYDPTRQPNGWLTKSPNDPSPFGGSYKLFFLHWEAPYSERGALTYSNSARLDYQYYVTGLQKTSRRVGGASPHGLNQRGAPEFRDREWYEFVFLHRKTGPTTSESGAWVRRLTSGGGTSEQPGPWSWSVQDVTFSGEVPRVASVEFGGNKNHGNEFDQWILWGPWAILDASRDVNPFGVPFR